MGVVQTEYSCQHTVALRRIMYKLLPLVSNIIVTTK